MNYLRSFFDLWWFILLIGYNPKSAILRICKILLDTSSQGLFEQRWQVGVLDRLSYHDMQAVVLLYEFFWYAKWFELLPINVAIPCRNGAKQFCPVDLVVSLANGSSSTKIACLQWFAVHCSVMFSILFSCNLRWDPSISAWFITRKTSSLGTWVVCGQSLNNPPVEWISSWTNFWP